MDLDDILGSPAGASTVKVTKNFEGKDFVDMLYRFFREEREDHQREDGVFWVTDLVACSAKIQFSRKYPELELAKLFDPVLVQGTLVHYGVEWLLGKMLAEEGYEVKSEVEGSVEIKLRNYFTRVPLEEVVVKGRADLLAFKDNERIGVEVKTARADLSLPHEHHVDQARIYNTIFSLDATYIVYVTPDRIAQFVVDNRMGLQDIARRIVEQSTPRYDWECQYCPFSILCPYKVTKQKK